MTSVLAWATLFAMLCLACAMGLAAIRLMRGPAAQDRVLALDTFYMNGMLLLLVIDIRFADMLYFEAALVIGLLGFVGTLAMAKFLLRGEVIE